MESRIDRRRWPRTDLTPPEVGIVYFRDDVSEYHSIAKKPHETHFIDILNKSQSGALLRSSQSFHPDTVVHLEIYNSASKSWDFFPAEIKWENRAHDKAANFIIGVAFLKHIPAIKTSPPDDSAEKQKPSAADYVFFRKVRLLRLLNRDAVCPILNAIFHKHLKAGERLIQQGEAGDAFYVIQKGNCSVNIEKEGELHRLALRSEYDVIGEMAIITGEPRSAHVDAETDMEVWGLSIEDFNKISKQYPELRSFMTEIVAFEMVTGKRPYPEDDLMALLDLHLEQDIPDPAEMVKDLPGDLRRFIITCCHRNRNQRYQSISHAMEDLKPLSKALRPIRGDTPAQNQRMATFVMIYSDEHQLKLNRIMEDFSNQVRELGVVLRATDFNDD